MGRGVQSLAWHSFGVKHSLRAAQATVTSWGRSLLEAVLAVLPLLHGHPCASLAVTARAASPHLPHQVQPGAPDPCTAPACNKRAEKVRPRPERRILLVSCHPAAAPHQVVPQTHPMTPWQSTASAFSSACSGSLGFSDMEVQEYCRHRASDIFSYETPPTS